MLFLTRSLEGAVLSLLFCWLAFWNFEFIRARIPINSATAILVATTFLLICTVILLRALSDKLQKVRVVFGALAGVAMLLFMFNVFPTIIFAFAESSDIENNWQIRRNFHLDETLPKPDIYWFHMDGTVTLNTAEYYLDVPSNESRDRLLDLGFIINEDAELIPGATVQALPSLLSPDFYDSYLNEVFEGASNLFRGERQSLFSSAIERDDISIADDLAPYPELFHEFLEANYTITTIAGYNPVVFPLIDQFYNIFTDDYPFAIEDGYFQRHFLIDAVELVELLSLMTPVPGRLVSTIAGDNNIEWRSIPNYENEIDRLTETTLNLHHERLLYRALIDSLNTSSPSIPNLSYITLNFTHGSAWGWWNENESFSEYPHLHPVELYPDAHEYTLIVMFNMIDMILEQKPDAVIIIQADHGMHLAETQQALLEAGFTEEEALRLFNSTISAVRIPERYGGLDEPLDPLNITRELVNRFVGENYQLLDQ